MNRCVVLTSPESGEERILRVRKRPSLAVCMLLVVLGSESSVPASRGSCSTKGSDRIKTEE